MISGVYIIENTANGKRYVGSSKNVPERIRDHVIALRNGKHKNARLQASWNKYGESSFSLRQNIACRLEDLELYEQIAIDGYGAFYKQGGFNLRPKAFTNTGRPGSERQKAVTRARLIGIKNPKFSQQLLEPERQSKSRGKLDSFRKDPEVEAKRAAAIRAYYADPAVREKQASYVKGIKRSPETIEKLRKFQTERAARRKAAGYVLPRGPDGRILPRSAQSAQGGQ